MPRSEKTKERTKTAPLNDIFIREPVGPLDLGSLSTRTLCYGVTKCLNDRTRETRENKILSSVFLAYGQRAYSISPPVLLDLSQCL